MHGHGPQLLTRSFDVLVKQTFKDFEVVITDNSDDNSIHTTCDKYKDILSIRYVKNPRKGMAQNTNEGIKNARGNIIKILYMDDFLASDNSLAQIVENFAGMWLITGCEHYDGKKRYDSHFPFYNDTIHIGKNTIGSPSVLTIKNEDPLLFDETMTWRLDCDYYKRLHDKFGDPTILNEINVVIGVGKHQTTNYLTNTLKESEREYMKKKYEKAS